MVKIESIKPLWNDIVIVRVPKNIVEGRTVELLDDRNAEETVQYFEVINTGDDVKSVKIGDTVAVPWTKITDPVYGRLHGKIRQFGITSEDEVLGVMEDDRCLL